ncbi:MAG TPA: hybrid sensor histidine kinase/response regulator [Bryobacteraceae bacterium]|jgi:two-component system sensor histidine kinase/response regulator
MISESAAGPISAPLENRQPEPAPQGRIMVVDDQPANLRLMEDILRRQGHTVRSFPRARLALRVAKEDPPDLILLDITMPEMNGFEMCACLKAEPALADIPVIFLSALNDIDDKLKGFRCGGIDYITKPFQLEEVQARVGTHLKLHALRRELERHTEHLEELVQARTQELAEAHARLRFLDEAKSDFLKLISHELRTPLNGLLGVGELLLEELPRTPEEDEFRQIFEHSRQRILGITENALLLTQIQVEAERFQARPVPLDRILDKALTRASAFARSRDVSIESSPASGIPILGEEDLLVKALQSLIETGVKFSKPGQSVQVTCCGPADEVQVAIQSSAGRIPAMAIARFFEIFSIGEGMAPAGEMGLDPPIAHRILSLFGGSVTAENRDPAGIRITAAFKASS